MAKRSRSRILIMVVAMSAFVSLLFLSFPLVRGRWNDAQAGLRRIKDGIRPPPSHCPAGMSYIDEAFCIDQYEASTVVVLDNGTTEPHSPFLPVTDLRVRAVSQKGVVPQGYISRNEAEGACQEAGKRLCTDAEWLRACQGPNKSRFPYGDNRQPNVCVDTNRVSPLGRIFGDAGADYFHYEPMNDPRLNQVPGSVAPTGTFPRCTNSFRVYDMVGNLHEWTADPSGTFRGGYFLDTKINGEGCLYRTIAHASTYHDYSTGFRCCADPNLGPKRTAPKAPPKSGQKPDRSGNRLPSSNAISR